MRPGCFWGPHLLQDAEREPATESEGWPTTTMPWATTISAPTRDLEARERKD